MAFSGTTPPALLWSTPTTIVTRSGLLAAVATVGAFLAANGVTATVEVGWKRRPQQLNQGPLGANRVVFIPSDEKGEAGSLKPVRFPGQRTVRDGEGAPVGNIRSLLEWERQVVVSIWASDRTTPGDPNNEAAQIEAVETLFEWVVRATHAAPGAFASVTWGDPTFTVPAERSFGLELLAPLTFSHPIFDQPRDLVFPTTAAVSRAPYAPPTIPSSSGDT
jgi:hypothetical protein